MTHPQEPTRAPRAVTYARANQGVDRYRHPVHRPDRRASAGPSPRRANRMLNRKRFWFFSVVLALAFVLGAATLSAVFAGPPIRMAQGEMPEEPGRDREREDPPAERGGDEPPPTTAVPAAPGSAPDGPGSGSAGRGPSGPDAAPVPVGGTGSAGRASPYPVSGGRRRSGGAAGPDPGGGPATEPGTGPGTDSGTEPRNGDDQGDDPDDVYYANCNNARRAGAAPLYRGEPGYRDKLDRDGDGIACD